MVRTAATSAGQYNISVSALNKLAIPLPPREEAEYISEEVERRLSVVEKLEAAVEASLKQAEALRQSILKRAFSGELVAQDPDDEPASVLLERIRTERQAAKHKAGKLDVRARRKDPTVHQVPKLF
jgi:type I restriction enzyme S subunit